MQRYRPIVPSAGDRPLALPAFDTPKVSIVVPARNQWPYTVTCLPAIAEHTESVEYEVILTDDVSTDETVLAQVHGSRSYRLTAPFSAAGSRLG